MLKNMQIKLLTAVMGSLTLVLIFIIGIINIYKYIEINRNADKIISYLHENSNRSLDWSVIDDEEKLKDYPFSVDFFIVRHSGKKNTVYSPNSAVSDETALRLYRTAKKRKNLQGRMEYYRYGKYKNETIFLDRAENYIDFTGLLTLSCAVSFFGFSVVFLAVALSSKKILRPFIENMERQNEFIANASHELKTPIAVISADADVLSMIDEENAKWCEGISEQTEKLAFMIDNMIGLAQTGRMNPNFARCDIIPIVSQVVNNYKPLLQQSGQSILFEETGKSFVITDEKLFEKIIDIAVDNAVKYSSSEQPIKVFIEKQRKAKVIIQNCTNEKINISRIFDRFYRGEESHNSDIKGHGIGLAYAKSIAEALDIHLDAKMENNIFTLTIESKVTQHEV